MLSGTKTDKGNQNPELYPGSLPRLFLGAVASILILSSTQQSGLPLGVTAFTAGLALEGASEAASMAATPSKATQSSRFVKADSTGAR